MKTNKREKKNTMQSKTIQNKISAEELAFQAGQSDPKVGLNGALSCSVCVRGVKSGNSHPGWCPQLHSKLLDPRNGVLVISTGPALAQALTPTRGSRVLSERTQERRVFSAGGAHRGGRGARAVSCQRVFQRAPQKEWRFMCVQGGTGSGRGGQG